MTAPKSVAVLGAGIVGISTAIWLLREGHSVTIIDRLPPGEGASHGNGGVLAACSMVPVTGPGLIKKAPRMALSPTQPLFVRWGYLPRLMPWLVKYLSHANAQDTARIASALTGIVGDSLADHQALSQGTEAEKYIVPSEYSYLYANRAAYEADAFAWGLRRDNGFVWREVEGAALRAYDPCFSSDIGFAATLGDHGRISDPGQYVKALARHAESQGARIIQADITDLTRDNGQVTGVRMGGETLPCDAVAICLGAHSKAMSKLTGVTVPLESERGYHLELWEPSVMPKTPVMIASGKFVATPMDGRLRLAGVVEFGGLEAKASAAPIDLLRRNIRAAIPGLTWAREVEWMGHRPAPSDSIPLIGPSPGVKGAWLGFGHHHIGLTGGPKTGRLLAQMISGRTPNIDVTPYSPSRFA